MSASTTNTSESSPRLPISLCMIAGAEAERIGQSLSAVVEWVFDVHVVINDDVNDETESIARTLGATVYRESWKGHIDQKNSAAAKATQPWILALDADEVVSAELRGDIQSLFRSPDRLEQNAAWCFPRTTEVCGRFIKHGDWYPDRQTRLWKKGSAKWGGVNPHDKLEVRGSVGKLGGDLLHYGVLSLNQQLAKIPSYSDQFVVNRMSKGRRASWLDLWFRPFWTFFRGYVIRLGFLDGWQGYYVARMNAFTALTRYAKLRAAHETQDPNPHA